MAMNLNIVAIIGNLTRDPELRHTPAGTPVTTLRIAVNDRVKRQEEWTDAAYYFDVVVWGNQAEACAQYLAKGSKAGISGKLTWREWEAQDGSKRQNVEIVANTVQFLTPRSEQDRYEPSGDYTPPPDAEPARAGGEGYGLPGEGSGDAALSSGFGAEATDDDIPF